jgi:thioredoxin reductase (NADPH)
VCEFDGGQSVSARAVVLATGVDWRRLQAKGEDRLLGRGIFYGAARQEATHVVGKKVFIVGGGNSAGQAAMFLSSYAAEVKVLVRGGGLKLSMAQYLIDQITSKADIKVLPHNSIKRVSSGVGEGSMAVAFVHQYLAL